VWVPQAIDAWSSGGKLETGNGSEIESSWTQTHLFSQLETGDGSLGDHAVVWDWACPLAHARRDVLLKAVLTGTHCARDEEAVASSKQATLVAIPVCY